LKALPHPRQCTLPATHRTDQVLAVQMTVA